MRGSESYHAFLDGLAMALDVLQAGNPSEALALLAGSKRGVGLWTVFILPGTDLYSYRSHLVVIDPV
jgi:hypothetical protein